MQSLDTARRHSTLQHSSSGYTDHPELQSNHEPKTPSPQKGPQGQQNQATAWVLMAPIDATCGLLPAEAPTPASLLPLGSHMPSLAWEILGQQPPKRCPHPAWPCTGASKCHVLSVWIYISFWHCSVSNCPRHGLQGMFFYTCKKAGKCMEMSCKSAEK